MLKILLAAIAAFASAYGEEPKQIIVSPYAKGVDFAPGLKAVTVDSETWEDIKAEHGWLGVAPARGHVFRVVGIPVQGA